MALSLVAREGSADDGTFKTTHYGVSYQGQGMACGGVYDTADEGIVAVGPPYYRSIPCGTPLLLSPPDFSDACLDILDRFGRDEVNNRGVHGLPCLLAMRTDSCPGCGSALLDLSEAGQRVLCGAVGENCRVRIWQLNP